MLSRFQREQSVNNGGSGTAWSAEGLGRDKRIAASAGHIALG
jgi:hypothetical protein